ncbi:MAG TPA: energy transducer TonB [Candidatus Polarisedimenticolaceae bacterium]|nr:energy transducer TonB [Candidatus Polarisedimenticolaceae bacterium]
MPVRLASRRSCRVPSLLVAAILAATGVTVGPVHAWDYSVPQIDAVFLDTLGTLGIEAAACPRTADPQVAVCGRVKDRSTRAIERLRQTIDAKLLAQGEPISLGGNADWRREEHFLERLYGLAGTMVLAQIDSKSGRMSLSYVERFRPCTKEELVDIPPAAQPKTENPDTVLPMSTAKVVPTYPLLARRIGLAAKVSLRVRIDAEGVTRDICVAEGSRFPGIGFETAAMRAVERWRFTPARQNGRPVDKYCTLVVEFSP